MLDFENDVEFKKIQRKKLLIVLVLFAYIFTSLGLFLVDTIVFDGAGLDLLYIGIMIGLCVLFPISGIMVTRLNRNPHSRNPKPSKKTRILQVILIIILIFALAVVVFLRFYPQ